MKKTQGKEPKFEDCLQRLESLVQEMESGDLQLEDILKKYEEGNRLVKLCASKLNDAEQRIEVLMKEKNGSISLKPFEEKDQEEDDSNNLDENSFRDENSEKKNDLF